jgi:archaellum component FlaC
MSIDEKELIWVNKEFAEKYKSIGDEQEQSRLFQEYMDKLSQQSKDDYNANLEAMQEDVAIYTGLMLTVKQAFGKAKDEALNSSYTLWKEYEKELPSVKKNIEQIVNLLNPLEVKLDTINDKLRKINTWDIDKVSSSIQKFSELSGKAETMLAFLVKHFNEEVKP